MHGTLEHEREVELEQEWIAGELDSEDIPDIGSIWEEPRTGRHYEVTRAGGLEVELHPIGSGRVRMIDSRAWPAQFVPEE